MITADTITDEQIREMRESLFRVYWTGDHSVWDSINLCRHALAPYHVDASQRLSARTRCAEILNARGAK